MATKNAVAKAWGVVPSLDGKRWSLWPAGDKPAGTVGLPNGSSVNVLWVGNSLTVSGLLDPETVPSRTQLMLAQMGVTMSYTQAIQGGATFLSHAANSTTMAAIGNAAFDAVNFQGYDSDFYTTSAYVTRVSSLVAAAAGVGSNCIFEATWEAGGQSAAWTRDATTAAVAAHGGNRCQVGDVWDYFRINDPTFYAAWKLDSEHASHVGQWATALCYARFFSGRSIAGVTSIHATANAAMTAPQKAAVLAAVDSIITTFYLSAVPLTASVTISGPTASQSFGSGATVTYTATATDTSSGNLTSSIQWRDEGNVLRHTGGSFTYAPGAGAHTMTASVTGSDTRVASSTVAYSISSGSNVAPVAADISTSVALNTAFKQVNLTASVTDGDGTVDFSTLQIDSTGFAGVSVVQDGSLSTINFNYNNGFTGNDTILYRVADNLGLFSNWATINLAVAVVSGAATLNALSSYGVVAGSSGFVLTVSGNNFQSGDEIELWGTNLSTTFVNDTTLTASVVTGSLAARNFGCVRISRGIARSYPLPFEVYDTAVYGNNFHTTASTVMGLTYGSAPVKGASKTLDTAGTVVVRETDIADAPTAGNYTGTYSRYPNVSADGLYLLADRETSTSMALYRRGDRVNLGAVRDGLGVGVNNDIGEFHEPRWDTLGNRPGVIYYMRGMALYERDIVAGTAQVLIRDFTADFGTGYLQNDVEGLCSLDCRFWVWGQRDAGQGSGIIRIVRYDRLTNTYTTANHTTLGITLSLGGGTRFSKPNMVESSIRGDRVITHYGRVYPGNRDSEFGTAADMPRSWAPDFTDPKIIAVDETHSGQAFDDSMNQVYVSQNNRSDTVEWANTVTGGTFRVAGSTLNSQTFPAANLGTNGRVSLLSQATDSGNFALNIGYHVASSLSGVRRGFCLVGSYSGEGVYSGAQQLRMYRLSDARVWKLGHKPGIYPSGDAYRNEAQPALSHDCSEVVMGGNWNDLFSGAHREVFIAYLPRTWHNNAIWS